MKKIVFAFSVFAALMMSACLPETRNEMLGIPEGAILLSTENFVSNDTKTAVSGTSVVWVGGESIDFYVGSESTPQSRDVEISGTYAYVTPSGLTASDTIRAYYPAGTATNRQTANNPAVKIPAVYTSYFSGKRQVIGLPMLAKADKNAGKIKFYHITAAINVMLTNSESTDLYVDSVVVLSDSYALNNTSGFGVKLKRDNPPEVSKSSPDQAAAWRRVKLDFHDSPVKVTADNDDTVTVQVPIRPIGADNLTIKVYCKGGEKKYIYSHSALTSELKRNEVLTAKVDLRLESHDGGHMVEVVETYRKIDVATASFPFTARNGDTLCGTLTAWGTRQCYIPQGVTVTLKGLNIGYTVFEVQGDASINIEGSNSINAPSTGRPAIFVANGKKLTILGDGTLTIKGGTNAAAIGCGNPSIGYGTCGNIEIEGGTIDATGGNGNDAAAIGTGNFSDNTCGSITIKNTVTKVTAKKGKASTIACIGTGIAGATCGVVKIGDVTQTVTVSETVYNGVDANGSNNTYTYTPSK